MFFLLSLSKVILGQNSKKVQIGKLGLNGLHRDHLSLWETSDPASVGVKIIKFASGSSLMIEYKILTKIDLFIYFNSGFR